MKSPEIHIFWYQFLTWILLNFSRQISQHLLAGRLLQWWDHPHVQRKDRHDRGWALWIASALQVSFHLPIFQGFSGGTATETDGGSLWLFWVPVFFFLEYAKDLPIFQEYSSYLYFGYLYWIPKVGWRGYTGCSMGDQPGVHRQAQHRLCRSRRAPVSVCWCNKVWPNDQRRGD